ncbi:MAG: lysophospholipase [Roseibaca calidilacus]|uniref:Alpha/beta hydrolase family protein n=1 Tax=Roseibaca calidilacus TaxID=1666912 RepID=A0A0P7WT66_9RHOB|nr:alpha/beta fold hydrolase [Roseibaca calidilacus]KPP90525.1 MAG: lysophospholipase [Roseibaca calidilacus]CUX83358.1 Alpha/beta hydrolase family protein [Roseibaca calidilacus]
MRVLLAAIAAILMALSIWQLEQDRSGLTIRPLEGTGTTPASLYLRDTDAKAPVVVIAHGFAGSRQLMEPFALTLAQAGYLVASFDFEGHGRNPVPMSGDVTSPDGTTRLLMAETARVARAALAHPRADGRLAYLGHSMASDIVIRQALSDPPGDAVVAVSMFSQAVTGAEPVNLLAVSGAWETRLVQESLRVLRLTDPEAQLGQTTGDPAQGTGRRAVAAPMVEHVGVLYSQTALAEARDWLDAAFGRSSDGPVPARGGWIALLLVATAALGWPMARSLPRARMACPQPGRRGFWLAALVPALVTPLLLAPFDLRFLPVLVADYLAVHLAVYGAITLVFCWRLGLLRGQFPARAFWVAGAVAVFGIAVFGGVLDRYVASFVPHAGRVPVVAGLALGAVPFLLGDAILSAGGRAPVWRVLVLRVAFLASLALAVALDFEGLFFLVIILPVIVLFFLLFGTMGGWVGRRTGLPAAAGIGLGLVLAWSLGVSFPMFNAI